MLNQFVSALDTASGHTRDNILPGKEEDDDHRNDDDRRSSHHTLVTLTAFGHERIQAEWQGPDFLGVGGDHRPQEGVPSRNRVQQDDGRQRRLRHRNHDPPEILPVGTAIDLCRLIERLRNGIKETLQDISIEELSKIKGIGKIKAIQIIAACEIARRMSIPTNVQNLQIKN